MEPEIVQLPAFVLIGTTGRFISAVSPAATNMQVIPPLWDALMARRAEVAALNEGVAFGMCRNLPPKERQRDDECEYLAGFVVAGDAPVPAGMARREVAAQTYARFVHRGPVSTFSETVKHALWTWLPQSDFALIDAPELEVYDQRFRGNDPASEIDYLVPVQRKDG